MAIWQSIALVGAHDIVRQAKTAGVSVPTVAEIARAVESWSEAGSLLDTIRAVPNGRDGAPSVDPVIFRLAAELASGATCDAGVMLALRRMADLILYGEVTAVPYGVRDDK